MKRRNGLTGGAESGFSVIEMSALLLLMLAFLAGVVLLTGRAVSRSQPDRSFPKLSAESDAVFRKLDALLGSADVISLNQPGLAPHGNDTGLVFTGDLEGRGRDETVLIFRSADRRRLIVEVLGAGGPARRVTLTSLLDRSAKTAFAVEYLGAENGPGVPGAEIDLLRVRLVLRQGSDSRSFAHTIRLPERVRFRQG